MRYLLIGLVLIGLIGCGSTGAKQSDEVGNNPSSPITKDSSKKPPSIPHI
jgi:hypothetical protein